MKFSEYQKLASRTISPTLNSNEIELHALHCLSSEVGEVHGIYQKMYQGHAVDNEHLKKEIGDCFWALAELCTVSGFDMDEIAKINIDKLKARYPNGFDPERSLRRKDGDV